MFAPVIIFLALGFAAIADSSDTVDGVNKIRSADGSGYQLSFGANEAK